MGGRRGLRWAGACCLLAVIGSATAGPAGATADRGRAGPSTCAGTQATPGVLSGTYASGATVTGYCEVDGGATTVDGTLTVAAGATLVASYAKNDVAGSGTSSLTVTGNLKVGSGATLILGCEGAHYACTDNSGGTLNGSDHVGGNLVAHHALGVVVHLSSIGGSVTQVSGGGGVTCVKPASGPFATTGVYSDYEDDTLGGTLGGNLKVTGLRSCWIGMLRNHVPGNLVDSHNTFYDPDANETLANTVGKNISCTGNSPAVQYGDSGASPNHVTGNASGECAFTLASGTPVSVKA